MLVKLKMEEWYRCRSSKTTGDFTEQICWKTTDTEPSGLHGRVHHEDILSQTITLKMKKDDKFKSENNATAKNLDEEMFVDCIEKIGHHISLVEQQNLVQWIFHINWGMQKLDEFFGTLLNMKNELKVYMKDDEYNSKIQVFIYELHHIFNKINHTSMIWEKELIIMCTQQISFIILPRNH